MNKSIPATGLNKEENIERIIRVLDIIIDEINKVSSNT